VSDGDSILCGWIEGTAPRLATDKSVTDTDAAAELWALAAGRTYLLAEVAGVSVGFSGDDRTKYVTRKIADLCIAAGADQGQLEHWVAVGQGRAVRAQAVQQTYPELRGLWV
jgi:hypothetical protein